MPEQNKLAKLLLEGHETERKTLTTQYASVTFGGLIQYSEYLEELIEHLDSANNRQFQAREEIRQDLRIRGIHIYNRVVYIDLVKFPEIARLNHVKG